MRIWRDKTVDQEFADLGTAGYSGTLNDRQFGYLRGLSLSNALPDMMFAFAGGNGAPPLFYLELDGDTLTATGLTLTLDGSALEAS